MPYSENANVSLKQSDLAHFIPGLAYHCGKKLDDALLIPVCASMANRNFGAKPLYAYARIKNRLETGHCTSNMIYESIGNWPLYVYDL